MRFHHVILLCFIFINCKAKYEKYDSNYPDSNNDSLIPLDCIPVNFTTPLGTKIMYTKVNNSVSISWGDMSYTRSHDSLFTCYDVRNSGRWDFIPKYTSETKNNLVFSYISATSSGGNPAPLEYAAIVLPKNNTDKIYEKDLFIAIHDNYLLCAEGWTGDTLAITNIESRKTQLINLNPSPGFSRSPTLPIIKTYLKNNILKIKYEAHGKNDETIIVKRNYRIYI